MSFLNKKRLQSKVAPELFILGFLLIIFAYVGVGLIHHVLASSPIDVRETEADLNEHIEFEVYDFFIENDTREMIPVIACESAFRHFEADGSVLKNSEGSSAIGVAQILSSVHPDPRVVMSYNRRFNTDLSAADFDLTKLQDNLAYALVLYRVRGTKAWECG